MKFEVEQLKDKITEKKTADLVNDINKITKSMQEIARQTNLLSLNASIEAARAGDAGKGFSVVSENLQDLANQSNDITKSLQEILISFEDTNSSSKKET